MAWEARDPAFERLIRESFARQKVMALIGAVLGRVEPGRVTVELPFRDDLTQQHGFFHAGVVGTVADSAGGYAGYSLMPPGSSVMSVEYKINLLAPADGERLVATGQVVRAGRTLTVCDLEVEVMKGAERTLCARGMQTLIRLDRGPRGAAAG
ncbi:MAG: PaaI family thioesterase [Candidatus Eisenbacteria bacterium]|nr:PaaI family thioesterase [Candidatus Eisenbacteria bacterium]